MNNDTAGWRLSTTFLAPLAAALALLCSPAWAGFDPGLLAGMKARAIGPAAMSGRIAAIDAVASDPNRLVVGASTGGVWMSDNGGLTWRPVFDDQPVASIGAVAINQSNPDIIWVGTGEGNVRNSTSIGAGIFKSIDGGRTWQRMGLAASERINRIALDPDDPDVAYVAALGTLWGPNEERGVFKTNDGGKSWQKILYVNDSTGATDIKLDPANPNKLYAAMWQFRRWPYYFKSGGPGSGMYISKDGGASWQRKTREDGLPAGELGRMVFALSPSNPERVYALVEAEKSALLRSDDGGESWTAVNEDYDVAVRPFYYTELAVDPENQNIVYNIGSRVRVSIDGGKTFTYNPVIDCCAPGNTIHIDNHAYWINPNDPDHLIFGNDGGLAISHDKGQTFRFVRNLPLAQFYHIAVDDDRPYHVYGGLQDNGSWRGPAEVWENAGIRNAHWQEIGFGDGFDALPDPTNSRSGYAMSQGGYLFRWNLDTGEQRMIMPDPPKPGVKLRFNWNAALAIDPFDPGTIYFGSQYVHRSRDRGLTWETISGDLTSNDPKMQTFTDSGGLTADVTAAENYTTIVSIAPSTLEQGVLWVGSDDGRVHVTRDGGENWTRIDEKARGVAAGAWVPMIAPSPHQAGTAFVVFDDHRRSDMSTYVYRVDDYGKRWKRLPTQDLNGYALSVLQDMDDPDLLFVGTEFGLYFSVDGGSQWTRFKAGLPTVSVMDMAIQPRENDLVLGTHGRAAYVIDDYSGLRHLSAADFKQRLTILSATQGQQYTPNETPSSRFTGSGEFRGENEPYGVMLTFMASGGDLPLPDPRAERARKIAEREQQKQAKPDNEKAAPAPRVAVTVKDSSGKIIRSYQSPVFQGVNRLVWGMQRDGIRPVDEEKAKKDGDDSLPPGPEILPGRYTITLTLGKASAQREVEVVKDPRSPYPMKELEANYQTRVRLLKMHAAANTALRQIISARADVATLGKLIDRQLEERESDKLSQLKQRADEIKTGLDELEILYRVPEDTKGITYSDDKVSSKIDTAAYFVDSSDGAPSKTALAYLAEAETALREATARVNAYMAGDLASFRGSIDKAGISLLPATEAVQVPE